MVLLGVYLNYNRGNRRWQQGISKHCPVIIFVGRFHPANSIRGIVSFSCLCKSMPRLSDILAHAFSTSSRACSSIARMSFASYAPT